MLILFWPKSRAMCRNLRGGVDVDAHQGLKPAFLMAFGRHGCSHALPKSVVSAPEIRHPRVDIIS